MRVLAPTALVGLLSMSSLVVPPTVHAMCSCMVRVRPPRPPSEAGPQETLLLADASMVVLMREGRRTVLTMRNDYQGPPEDFALVVPVPEILEESQVRTLPHGLLERLDRLSAPRLAEYWEQDPCGSGAIAQRRGRPAARSSAGAGVGALDTAAEAAPPPPPVIVEREFSVDEYDIEILTANDSSGLERWLTSHGYTLPDGAAAVFRPYVEQGTKFFVAKVDASRVRFESGRARLSPLQFNYDADTFGLPIRLGLLNSPGQQDLVVQILGRGQRYQLANHPNATIPTNVEVDQAVRDDFAGFYEALFARVVANAPPRAVVTEYASRLNPGDLRERDIRRLGADALPSRNPHGLTLTRLHYRYTRETIGEDLVFSAAPAIGGGDGEPGPDGALGPTEPATRPVNSFRGRFGIVHRWTGGASCANPIRGRWRRPTGEERRRFATPALGGTSAIDQSRLASLVTGDLGDLGLSERATAGPETMDTTGMVQEDKDRLQLMGMTGDTPAVPGPAPTPAAAAEDDGLCSAGGGTGADLLPFLALLALVLLLRRPPSA